MKVIAISKIKRTVSLAGVLIVLAITLAAQSNTGSITGVVSDPNGAVVPNATVNVTNQATNEKRTVQSDDEGRYDVPSLSTGVYTVEATGSGFQTVSLKDVRLAVGERARVDVALVVGGTDVTVDVVDQTRTDTESSTLGDTVDSKRIEDNPVNGRDFTQLLATVPGSVQTGHQFQTAINGIPSTFGGTSVLVDGIDASRVDVNGTSNVLGRIESRVNRVSMDSIQEVQVLEQNYSAQYGQAIGAVINPITKSGGNQFHGSVFEYFRNEALDADDALAGKQRFRLNQFGGNISGPIHKDSVFFFTNYEGVRQSRGTTFNNLVFTQAFRSGMAPAIAPVVSTIPLPQRPFIHADGTIDADLGEYSEQKIADLREDTGSFKFDWVPTDKQQFSFRYNINDSKTEVPYGVGSDQIADGKLLVQLFKASHNYAFNATTSNEFGIGVNHNYTRTEAGQTTLPRFDLSFVNFRINPVGPAQFDQERTGIVTHVLDTLTMVRGDHSLKVGVDARFNRRDALLLPQDTLLFFSVNDFKTNAPFVISHQGTPELSYANENFSVFINDDWKAHRRLTFNLGLRYEVSSVSREKNGHLQNFDLATLTYTAPGEPVHNVDWDDFGPRFGFAFDVFGKGKTVIRGGYGIFYNRMLPASFGSPHVNSFPQVSTDLFDWFFCGPGGGPTFAYPVDPRVFNCGQAQAMNIERDLKTAMAQQYSLNVQHDLGIGTLSVGYVGNHVTHILTDGVVTPINANRVSPIDGATRPLSQNFADILLVGGYPQSNYNALQATFKRNWSKGLRFNANYTWGHAIDNVVGFFQDYQNPNDADAERASSDQDVRHNFSFDAGYDLKFHEWFGGPRWLTQGWQVNTITQIRSGFPVTVRRQGGSFGGFSFRPNAVPGVDPYCSPYDVPNCQFNPDAFDADLPAGTFGNLGRNTLRGPSFVQSDVSFFKDTRITENTSLHLRMEIFNIFNFANYADPSGGLSCAGAVGNCVDFGKSFSTVGNNLGGLLGFGGPRQIQLSARFNF
ncbi:MAG TPA: carboxypeptidase regulatory-like domain-containing protein [Pyrinomonadaceae bacterium]|nr:carboxypeptidase regulatory-like domain-containing protein [Pyrinomonadaceae bacterium]